MGGRVIGLRPKRPQTLTQRMITGVRDSIDPANHDASLAFELTNVYPVDPFVGAGVVGRPGTSLLTGAQIVSGEIQAIAQYGKLDGTERTLLVAAGEIYEYIWATDSVTKRIATADLTAASITLSATGRVYWVVFNDVIVFSDGTNTPFSWDGTASGGLTSLTNAPVMYGQPVVYYAKLFAIKNSERSTIVWSEENQPNTGYEAGGFNNAWTLGQTDQSPIIALEPTNAALYYRRERSKGAVWGEVSTNFQTTGTHEALSTVRGTASPRGGTVVGNRMWWIDADARIRTAAVGGAIDVPGPWRDARETLDTVNLDALDTAEAVYWQSIDVLSFAVPTGASSSPDTLVNFHPETGKYLGTFTGWAPDVISSVLDTDSKPRIIYGTSAGYAFLVGLPEGSVWSDRDTGNNKVAIAHAIETAPFGHDIRDLKLFQRADVTFIARDLTSVPVKLSTEKGTDNPGLSWDGVNLGTLWNNFNWDSGLWSEEGGREVRTSFGFEAYARWLRLRFEHETTDEEFGYLACEVEVYIEGADAEVVA